MILDAYLKILKINAFNSLCKEEIHCNCSLKTDYHGI